MRLSLLQYNLCLFCGTLYWGWPYFYRCHSNPFRSLVYNLHTFKFLYVLRFFSYIGLNLFGGVYGDLKWRGLLLFGVDLSVLFRCLWFYVVSGGRGFFVGGFCVVRAVAW